MDDYVTAALSCTLLLSPDLTAVAKSPRLFTFSGRTKEGVEQVLDAVQGRHAQNLELQALLQEQSGNSSTVHPFRGYTLLNHEGAVRDVQVCVKPPGQKLSHQLSFLKEKKMYLKGTQRSRVSTFCCAQTVLFDPLRGRTPAKKG